MSPPDRQLRMTHLDRQKVKESSVLLLLFPHQGGIYTCLTKRSAEMKAHPGQVSFPGGRIEEGETPEVTALREAQEEVGVDPSSIQILGQLSDLYIPVSQFVIYPFVGWVDQKPDFELNVAEAEKLILFPVDVEEWEKTKKMVPIDGSFGRIHVPAFQYEGETVWGATSMILAEFLDLVHQSSPTMFLKD